MQLRSRVRFLSYETALLKEVYAEMGPQWYDKSILILGCGNVLLGDDGFGPAVAEYIQRNVTAPAEVGVLNAGTSVREMLFDVILSDNKPHKIVIVDAMDCGREPGELFAPDLDSMPQIKLANFSLHQVPTSNLLRELRDLCSVEVVVIACQVSRTPDMVSPGLSDPVEQAVSRAADILTREHFA
jgi:coenzyme F420 hydrogenase subunit delta